jgi:hypothetical protein
MDHPSPFSSTTSSDKTEPAAPHSAAGVADAAKDAAQATYEAVSAQASAIAASVGEELATTGEAQKQRGADTMCSFAAAVKRAAGDLGQESPKVAHHLSAAADKVESLATSLRSRSVNDLIADVSDLARRQPAMFFAGSVVAGFALGRFLKSGTSPSGQSGNRRDGQNDLFSAASTAHHE